MRRIRSTVDFETVWVDLAECAQVWVVRVGGDEEELRPGHYIYVYSIESRLIMNLKETQSRSVGFSGAGERPRAHGN